MGFIGVYKASYDYKPQGEGELEISEGDILYVLEKSTEDDWWKAKKKATSENDDEPTGLIPCNYIEEVRPKTDPGTLEGQRGDPGTASIALLDTMVDGLRRALLTGDCQ